MLIFDRKTSMVKDLACAARRVASMFHEVFGQANGRRVHADSDPSVCWLSGETRLEEK